jgi:hypothetical protein
VPNNRSLIAKNIINRITDNDFFNPKLGETDINELLKSNDVVEDFDVDET